MDANTQLDEQVMAHDWNLFSKDPADDSAMKRDSYRLAFADPEFLSRRETRAIRFQLEMLKPDLELSAQGINNTVVVFGSARFVSPEEAEQKLEAAKAQGDAKAIAIAQRAMATSRYYDAARRFARLVAKFSETQKLEDRLYICTGGGPGIMEAANRGAHEERAPNVGMNITLPHEQSGNRYITPELCFKFHYFALRKMHLMMRAKALVVFPGGFGTMDELFEVLTLVQTHKAKGVPIVLFGSDFWSRMLNFDVMIEYGTISADDVKLFHITDDVHEACRLIQAFYQD
ncbi:TIGR00730 family Rossman fold protein [Comamonas odontotermitis]|uniref:LOG family protein n=1 Tax=Comamonas TaxID=283 RepID=UPI001CC7B8E2|nr:TIGR00730 family Rossman fold protein [Comamonas odontotermitis]UBB18657.1 TIGR00730 family Rossman fold protein [Comamonas odontotermitis]